MCPPAEIKIFTLETACPIKNFIRLSLHHRRRKRLILPTIQCFQGFPALLPLRHRPIRRQILGQISDQIALAGHTGGAVGEPGGSGGIHARCAVHKISVEPGGLDLLIREVPGQLVDDGANHFQMPKFVRPIRLSAEAAPAGAGTASVSLFGRG